MARSTITMFIENCKNSPHICRDESFLLFKHPGKHMKIAYIYGNIQFN